MKLQHEQQRFVELLIDWYAQHARVLPWRQDASPYRIWVSEIMLQQTRVEAVKPYFERFIQALPSIDALANAPDDVLTKLWEGLGYYHRVKNMKRCAQLCVEKYNKALPSTYEELLTLPGIGPYTAGAIASIAFQERVPAIDGNVLRVFSRVWIDEEDILKETVKRKYHERLMSYIPQNSGNFNQAVMELGALICVPNAAPRCNICPVSSHCLGYQSGDALRLPNKAAKKKRRIEKRTIIVLVCNDKVLIQKREDTGLLAGLYTFINQAGHIRKQEVCANIQNIGYTILDCKVLSPSKHVFSHIEWHMKGFLVSVASIKPGLWCTDTMLEEQYAIPTAFKVYRDALKDWWNHERQT